MKAPVSPAEAKAILDALPGRKSLAALRRELVRRGEPVSLTTIRKWHSHNWQRKGSAKPLQSDLLREVRATAECAGLPADAIRDVEVRLTTMSDGDLVVSVTRSILIGAALLLELAKAMAPELMRTDQRGLAALYIAASRMTEGAHVSMTEARNLAERAMTARLALMLPGPRDTDRDAERDGDRDSQRADTGRRPFADLITKFGPLKPTDDDGTEDRIHRPGPARLPPRAIQLR